MSEKSRLTNRSVEGFIRAGKTGEHRCSATRGLVLRIKGSGVFTWNVRRSQAGTDHRIDLGNLWTLDEARDLANEVDRRLRAGQEPWTVRGDRGWAEHLDAARRTKLGLGPAPKPVVVEKKPFVPSYLWEHAVELHHGELLRTRRESTALSYRSDLLGGEMARFKLLDVKDVTRQAVATAIAEIHKRGAERRAATTTIAVRSFFKFLGRDDMTSKTGVEWGRMADLRAPENTFREEDDDDGSNRLFVPDGPCVSALVNGLRGGKALERDLLAGQLLVYTVQRRRAVALARVGDFEEAPGLGGLWKLPPLHRKTASMKARRTGIAQGDHVVPLPPSAWKIVRRAIEIGGGSDWLFPGTRPRRSGGKTTSMSPSRLSELFRELPGNLAAPHDLRRAFGTTFAAQTNPPLSLHQVKIILDHNEGVASGDVTTQHYSFLTGEHEKWPVMREYVAWVDRWAAWKD